MLSVTPTKLSDYLVCPQKYRFRHINKNEITDASAALSFGRTMHNALQALHQSDQCTSEFSEISELLTRYWEAASYSDAEEDESYFVKGCQALHNYCKNFDCLEETTIGTEVYLSSIFTIGDLKVRFGCKADRICTHDNEILEIIDYKTNGSGRVPTLDSLQIDLPTFIYYVLARVSYPEYKIIRITFLNILTLAKVSINYDARQVATNKQSLLKCLKSLDINNFTPTPSEACSWCSFQNDCSAFNKTVDFASIL